MSMTDTISDMLTRIRNAHAARLLSVSMPSSKAKQAILDVLIEEGYIASYNIKKGNSFDILEVVLKYSKTGEPVISELKKVSKPGKRIYTSIGDLPEYYNGMGIYILFTSKGVISDRVARSLGVGGEVVCKVF